MEIKIQKSLLQENIKKHAACNYGDKLAFVGNKFSKLLKSYLGEDAVHNFINSII